MGLGALEGKQIVNESIFLILSLYGDCYTHIKLIQVVHGFTFLIL